MASPSSSHYRNNKDDVFLNFEGEDNRNNFTSHLYSALSQKNIETFFDDNLKRGEEISPSLVDAIEVSRISIIMLINQWENKCTVSNSRSPGSAKLRYLHWTEMPRSHSQQLWDSVRHHGKLKQKIIGACNIFTKIPNPSWIPPLNKLVILNLSCCESLESLPAEIFLLEFLKTLNLLGCSKLKMLPEFSSAGKIEEIWLDGTAIEELTLSIGCLSRLLILHLSDCKRLKSLPSSICQLKSLKVLNLHGCSNLQRLPYQLGNLEASYNCYTNGTAIREVTSSNFHLNNKPYELSLDRSTEGDTQMGLSLPITLSLDGLHMTLTCLYLNYCGIIELPESLGQLCSLVSLHLEKNSFERIPESIKQLSRLVVLNLNYCERLQSLPKLPCNLVWLYAHHCTALSSTSYKSSAQLSDLSYNFKLDRTEVRIIVEDALQDIQLTAATRWKQVLEEGYFLEKSGHVILPGNEIPKWFWFQSVGSSSSITLEMPSPLPGFFSNNNRPVLGFAFSAIVAFGDHRVDYCDGWCEFLCELGVISKDCQPHHVLERCDIALIRYVESDHLVLGYYLFGDEDLKGFREYNCAIEAVAVHFYFQDFASSQSLESCGAKVKKCGFHLLYAPDSTEEEPYADSYD